MRYLGRTNQRSLKTNDLQGSLDAKTPKTLRSSQRTLGNDRNPSSCADLQPADVCVSHKPFLEVRLLQLAVAGHLKFASGCGHGMANGPRETQFRSCGVDLQGRKYEDGLAWS